MRVCRMVFAGLLLLMFVCGGVSVAAPAPQKAATKTSVQKKQTARKADKGKQTGKKAASGGKAAKASPKSASRKASGGRAQKAAARPRDWSLDSAVLAEDMELPRNLVPVSVRGTKLRFERAVQASVLADDGWLLPNMSEADVYEALAQLTPTFVHAGIRLDAGHVPSHDTVLAWHDLRTALQKANSLVGFDIVIDLSQYATPEEVTAHMQKAGALLTSEAWSFSGAERVATSNPAILRAAVAEAHAQGRKCGVVVVAGSIAAGQDYTLISCAGGGKGLPARIEAARKAGGDSPGNTPRRQPVPPVLVICGDAFQTAGEGFARGKTPSQRRLTVMAASKLQQTGVAFAYPVFGPPASPSRSYNALRDEFMFDTIKRAIRTYNPVPPVSSLTDASARGR